MENTHVLFLFKKKIKNKNFIHILSHLLISIYVYVIFKSCLFKSNVPQIICIFLNNLSYLHLFRIPLITYIDFPHKKLKKKITKHSITG